MDLHDTIGLILLRMQDAEQKAWEALSGYKFYMFGYHCAAWVRYNQLLPKGEKKPNPFRCLVKIAREKE